MNFKTGSKEHDNHKYVWWNYKDMKEKVKQDNVSVSS